MVSKTSSTMFSFIFLLFILGVMAYLNTTELNSTETGNFLMSYSDTNEITETSGSQEEEDSTLSIIPILENKLVDTSIIDGYRVETYREFEIYQDENGQIVKTVPTSNYSYLRYDLGQ